MAVLLKYQLADGLVVGYWEANTRAMLDNQRVAEDPTYGYMFLEPEGPLGLLLTDYYITGGALTPKTTLTLTATPNPFAADGVATCAVTVEPFVACTLLVNFAPVALVEGDATLLLTSDIPRTFQVRLAATALYKAAPLMVEAT